mmetsp:Transcript_11069/g.23080  ORF Transcript_11069/g.23080 Transcript_11069/m.23080 type:complete len:220 (+) Transcript_11069:3861-4520(+)
MLMSQSTAGGGFCPATTDSTSLPADPPEEVNISNCARGSTSTVNATTASLVTSGSDESLTTTTTAWVPSLSAMLSAEARTITLPCALACTSRAGAKSERSLSTKVNTNSLACRVAASKAGSMVNASANARGFCTLNASLCGRSWKRGCTVHVKDFGCAPLPSDACCSLRRGDPSPEITGGGGGGGSAGVTVKLCSPATRRVRRWGDVHSTGGLVSSWQT